jgi:hypothetical protein
MESIPTQPTQEQLARRARAERIQQEIDAGVITDISELNPKDTSPEVVYMARRQLGRLAQIGINSLSGL